MQASNLAVQISNLDNKHFCLPWQTWDLLPPAKCKMMMMTKIQIQNTNTTRKTPKWPTLCSSTHHMSCVQNQDLDLDIVCCIFHIIVVNTTFSGWTYICFIIQHTCKCIQLPCGMCACNHCSPICLLDHICDTVIVVNHQTPGPVELQYGKAPPHCRHLCPSLSWDIQTSQSQQTL